MTLKIAINGFGRIGRNILRALIETQRSDIEVIAINDLGTPEINAHLLKYDTIHGTLAQTIDYDATSLIVNNMNIRATSIRNPEELPWQDVDIAIESTGLFTSKEKASLLLKAGAKRVLVSAPATGADITVVYGINHNDITSDHKIISNASCTTNCLAPIAKVLNQSIGIKKGFMTTIHAYTSDQNPLDGLHKDPRRARACAQNMVPTSTGAAKAVGLVLPEMVGKLNGVAIRVPVVNVSSVNFSFLAERVTSKEEINQVITTAANNEFKGVLGVNLAPLVSSDFNHNSNSSTFDATQTEVVDGDFVSVMSWYDNEWGFSNRMLDTVGAISKTL